MLGSRENRLFSLTGPRHDGQGFCQTYPRSGPQTWLKLSVMPLFHMVSIKRSSRIIENRELIELIRNRLEKKFADRQMGAGELIIKLREDLKPLHIASDHNKELRLSSFDWSPAKWTIYRSLCAWLSMNRSSFVVRQVRWCRSSSPRPRSAKGKIVSRSDLKMKYVQFSNAPDDTRTAFAELVGLSAKRRLPAGRPIQLSDLEAPRLIRKNQLVTILLEAPGLVLRTEGKALADATLGETLRVLNTQSKRIIHATAKASGLVFVKLSQPTRSGS